MNGVFLDWAATNPYVKFPIDTTKQWRNPNAAYAHEERKVLMDCEERIKAAIGAKSGHVLYFRCATDALEWLYERSQDVCSITWWASSPYEHDAAAIGSKAKYNELDGCIIDFYCHQLVNQLTGELFDIKAIHEQLMGYECWPFLICDCTAAIHHVSLRATKVCQYADAIVTSGHKYGCPDIAFMWIDDRLFEWLGGGKDVRNQYSLKHGSLSVGHVLALADAVEWACDDVGLTQREILWMRLSTVLFDSLEDSGIEFNVIEDDTMMATSGIFAIRLNGVNADALQQYAASKDVYIGIGASACAGAHDYRVLVDGYGLTEQEASEVIRVSFGEDSTVEDVDALVDCIKEYRRLFIV